MKPREKENREAEAITNSRLLPVGMTYPNGVEAVLGYDDNGNLTGINHSAQGEVVTQVTYGYDALNRRVSATGLEGRHEYGYDDRDWLVRRATGPEGTAVADENYSYDAVGNRVASHVGSGQDYGSDRLNRLRGDATYVNDYDGDGNLQSKVRHSDGAATTYIWDVLGRLTSVILPSGGAWI